MTSQLRSNPAVMAAPSGRWTLRDKAQRSAAPLTFDVRPRHDSQL